MFHAGFPSRILVYPRPILRRQEYYGEVLRVGSHYLEVFK